MIGNTEATIIVLSTFIHILACVWLAFDCEEHERRLRAQWARPIFQKRSVLGFQNTLLNDLATTDPELYRNFLRMDIGTFQDLLSRIRNDLTKQDTRYAFII
jgi:hypothetical protein